MVSQFMQTPRKPHLDAVRHILKYIKHTLQCELEKPHVAVAMFLHDASEMIYFKEEDFAL